MCADQPSVEVPILSAELCERKKTIIKHTTGNAPVNLTQLEGVVASEYHTQKLEASDRFSTMHNLSRGERERKERGRPQAEAARVQRGSQPK